ncbi:Ionotropic receptor 93a-like 19 [Homarus americanus]|uniref:Ionotropic receptor 93a-like 19 n=1 Tax=Homarus americanus TaxID=6706 RepID=A0A8J5TJT8_HOMAM|nr:Ionotropic receptor 93a-like 19 [Homarus americanus]
MTLPRRGSMNLDFLIVVMDVVALGAALNLPLTFLGSQESLGGAVRGVLEASSPNSCTVMVVTQHVDHLSTLLQEVREAGHPLALFRVEGGVNTTHSDLPHLVSSARKVRQKSWCVTVVVVSDDPAFLASFAQKSRSGRLLVWESRLMLVTRLLSLPQVNTLLQRHWTFSMMNTMLINLNKDSARWEVYTHQPYTPTGSRVLLLAYWTPESGLIRARNASLFPEKFTNFHGAHVPVTALILPPFWKVIGRAPDGSIEYSGRDCLMMKSVARALNFTIVLLRSSNIDEVMARLEDGRAMIFAFRVMLIPQVLARVDHTYFIDRATFTFSMLKPTIISRWQNLYYPLQMELVYASGNQRVRATLKTRSSVLEIVGMLLGQGLLVTLFRDNSTRMLVVVWLVFAFIICTAYRGTLTAFLTVPKYPHRPETIEELATTGVGVRFTQNATRFLKYFEESKLSAYKSVSSRVEIVDSVMAGLQEVSENKIAFFHERYNTELYITQYFTDPDGISQFYVARQNVIPNYAAYMTPHDAPYKHSLDYWLLRIIEVSLTRLQ